MENPEIKYRLGQIEDLEQLHLLNFSNLPQNIDNKKHQSHITFHFPIEDFYTMVCNNDVIIASHKSKILGYWLVSSSTSNKSLEHLRDKINTLKYKNKLLSEYILGWGCQGCIDFDFRKNGIFSNLIRKSNDFFKDKYQLLFGTVKKINRSTCDICINSGMELIHEDNERYYLVLEIKNTEL